MARQSLSVKSVKRYSRRTGLEILRMIARGGSEHWIPFVTKDHTHGRVRAGTYEVELEDAGCFTSCDLLFPLDGPWAKTPEEAAHRVEAP